MGGSVTAFGYGKGKLSSFQTISTAPPGFTRSYTGADIHISPDGKFLYASNRDSSNTIAIFRIDPFTGKLNGIGYPSTLGKTPRNFSLDPTGLFLLAANQNSGDMVVFKRDSETGLLTDTGNRIAIDKPVCIKWIEKK
jgi:6-phosphogluconolactonase